MMKCKSHSKKVIANEQCFFVAALILVFISFVLFFADKIESDILWPSYFAILYWTLSFRLVAMAIANSVREENTEVVILLVAKIAALLGLLFLVSEMEATEVKSWGIATCAYFTLGSAIALAISCKSR